jgi:hypothetical protein
MGIVFHVKAVTACLVDSTESVGIFGCAARYVQCWNRGNRLNGTLVDGDVAPEANQLEHLSPEADLNMSVTVRNASLGSWVCLQVAK